MKPTASEQWRAIPGHEGRYEVSDLGNVRSLLHDEPRPLRLFINPRTGYVFARLSTPSRASRNQTIYVHREVLKAFVGPRPEHQQVCHNDGDRTNNTLSNLRYGTASENRRDAMSHGTAVIPNTRFVGVLTA